MTTPAELTRSEFATLAGYKPSYVTELAKAGRLVLTEDGKRVRVAESLALIEATRDPARQGVADRHAAARAASEPAAEGEPTGEAPDAPVGDSVAPESNAYHVNRAQREYWLAKAAERDYRKSVRELMERAEVLPMLAEAATQFRKHAEQLRDTLAPALAAEPTEAGCRRILGDEVELMLAELARAFAAIANDEGDE